MLARRWNADVVDLLSFSGKPTRELSRLSLDDGWGMRLALEFDAQFMKDRRLAEPG
jgi:hypothetical protein